MWPFKREKRSRSFTDIAMDLRADWIAGHQGVADLTATVQGCVNLWSQGLSIAETDNDWLTPDVLAITARSLATRGDALWLIDDDGLVPVDQFDISTRGAKPRAYRLTIPEVGGGRTVTALAGEVLHFKVGADAAKPWRGVAPLRRASLSAGLLEAVETALTETFRNAPLGSQIVPMPETAPGDNDKLAASFRGKRGRVLLRESTNVTAAGGPAPTQDWKPSDMTPNLRDSMSIETWRDARHAVLTAFGILPALLNAQATGPVVREAQRHLAQWTLQPMAALIAAEATEKLSETHIDVSAPLHAFDSGGRARAMLGVINAMATAKTAGLTDEQLTAAAKFAGVPD